MVLRTVLQAILTNPVFLGVWGVTVGSALGILAWDIRSNNREIAPLMKFVWGLTVLYSGLFGLGVYWYAGRKQIARDSLWRKGWRSVSHCYSGCGAGEVIGVTIAAGILSLDTSAVAVITFSCAYIMGFGLTVGPLVQEGVGVKEAITDAFLSETPSITIMEISAIGTDIWLAGEAHITDRLFWSGLVFSLSIGFLVAYPMNVWLVEQGVKGGMENPRAGANG